MAQPWHGTANSVRAGTLQEPTNVSAMQELSAQTVIRPRAAQMCLVEGRPRGNASRLACALLYVLNMTRVAGWSWALALAVGCAGVGSTGEDAALSAGGIPGVSSSSSVGTGETTPGGSRDTGSVSGGDSTTPLPAEVELSFDFELPAAGEGYVYAANPASDTVAVIDAETLAIQAVEAGDQPTFLQTLAGRDAAVVLNVGSGDATVIRTRSGVSTATQVDVQQGANAIAVAPDGKHAIVYFDANLRGEGATGSYQDLSVLFLSEGDEHDVAMTVGFRPSSVSFSEDAGAAFVVTEDGVSILDFSEIDKKGSHVARTVALGTDATASLDVSVTPDGKYALARREGESALRLADLDSGEVFLLDLADYFTAPEPDPEPPVVDAGAGDAGSDAATPTPPPAVQPQPQPVMASVTDVDLAPSGSFALAAIRDQSSVLRIDVPGAFLDDQEPTAIRIGDEIVGSVTKVIATGIAGINIEDSIDLRPNLIDEVEFCERISAIRALSDSFST